MPFPVPFVYSRMRRTPEAGRAYQQTEGLRVTVWDPSEDAQMFTVAAHWLTQGLSRTWTLRIWYAKGIYDGKTLPSLSMQAYALGTTDGEGAEIVDNDYIRARISGTTPYADMGTVPFVISASEVATNSYVDVDFLLAIPADATTLGSFFFGFTFTTGEATPWFDDGDFMEFGTLFDSYDPTERTQIEAADVLLDGFVYTPEEKDAIFLGGLTFPTDYAITPWDIAPSDSGIYIAEPEYLYTDAAVECDQPSGQYLRAATPYPPAYLPGSFSVISVARADVSGFHKIVGDPETSGVGRHFGLRFTTTGLHFGVRNAADDGGGSVLDVSIPFAELEVWGVQYGFMDAENGYLGVGLNGTREKSIAYTGGLNPNPTLLFSMGLQNTPTISTVIIMTGVFTRDDASWAYNAGVFRTSAEYIGKFGSRITSLWPLAEATGAKEDIVGGFDLPAYGSPALVSGPIEDTIVDRAPASRWKDWMGVLPDAVQSDITKQAAFSEDANGEYLEFVAASETHYIASPLALGHPFSAIVVANSTGNGYIFGGPGAGVDYSRRMGVAGGLFHLSWATGLNGSAFDADEHVFSCDFNGTQSGMSIDGALDAVGDTGSDVSESFVIGTRGSLDGFLNGKGRYFQVLPGAINSDAYREFTEAWLCEHYGLNVTPPSISYPALSLREALAASPVTPTNTGDAATYIATSTLPPGVSLNALTGELTIEEGDLVEAAETLYGIRATNCAGSSDAIVSITVLPFTPWDSAVAGTGIYHAEPEYLYTDAAALISAGNYHYAPTGPSLLNGVDGSPNWVGFWFRKDVAGVSGFFSARTDGTVWKFVQTVPGNINMRFAVDRSGVQGNSDYTYTVPGWSLGHWYHVFIYHDGVGTAKFYVDGVKRGEDLNAGTFLAGNEKFFVGMYGTSPDGAMQQLVGGNTVVTDQQVADLYNSGSGVSSDDAVGIFGTTDTYLFPLSEVIGACVDVVSGLALTRFNSPGVSSGHTEDTIVDRAPVSRWKDRLGLTPDATQTDITKQPAYDEANAAVVGDGLDDFFGPITQAFGHPSEIIVCYEPLSTWDYVFGGNNNSVLFGKDGGATRLRWSTSLDAASATNDKQVIVGLLDPVASIIRINGVQRASGVTGTYTSPSIYLLATNAGYNPVEGPVHYIQLLPGGHNTTAYREATESYLMDLYGIT